MNKRLRILAATILMSAAPVGAKDAQILAPSLPPSADPTDGVFAVVTTGPLPPGGAVLVETPEGAYLGRIVPFGILDPQAGVAAMVRVPASAIVEGRVRLRLSVVVEGEARAPAPGEIVGVEIVDD